MNILLVDGNEKDASDKYVNAGMETQYEVYNKILHKLSNKKLNILTIHPAVTNNFIPKGVSLDDFDGIVWTGSLLNIYDSNPSILRQIELAKSLLSKKNSIFGSCWGLQILVTAAGGKVRKNPNGLEAVIAKQITLNDLGIKHPMYVGKKKKFDSFCWHYDEAEYLPINTKILASNFKSKIQAISFKNKDSSVWAVQYHPEFNSIWMSGLMNQRKDILLKEKIFNNQNDFTLHNKLFLNQYDNYKAQDLNISSTLLDEKMHTLELKNWLNSF
tara:strand:- start:1935 stop:2750 length:816 start_codon:yes stop_codon:yes gene_type:complete